METRETIFVMLVEISRGGGGLYIGVAACESLAKRHLFLRLSLTLRAGAVSKRRVDKKELVDVDVVVLVAYSAG